MYKVLSKDIIGNEILPHLSTAKRGFETTNCLTEVLNSILYKAKAGIQWYMLPVDSLFSDVVLSYKTVYWHFRKCSRNGEWEHSWLHILENYKSKLDLSPSSVDGTHTKALRGGEEVEFQTRKMSKTTNWLYLTDNQGIPIAISSPISGNHHDLYQIDSHLDELFQTLRKAKVETHGLFINADAGFESKDFRSKCFEYGIIANTATKPRNGSNDEAIISDENVYEQKYTIERTNAWMDSYRTLIKRFETTVSIWKTCNHIAFIAIFLKKIYKNKKSRSILL